MKKELPHYRIGTSYGGNQEWFGDFMMRIGGCAAETACECCIYLDKYKGTSLYPFDAQNITKRDYKEFGNVMKPYLHPRMSGIDKLSIYIEGFGQYLADRNSKITLGGIEGSEDASLAKLTLIRQIDSGIPVPYLCLYHKNPRFRDYEWHWFLINGYEQYGDVLMVKAVTYSSWEWLDFDELWNSGRQKKGGLIELRIINDE
ncbi:MAG: hypothetical protein E7571_03845 [Ruminococcaceae bacterium]|nr:hypothetical protein [Oscillospiraceae bacterium]